MNKKITKSGFTIIELLIVIVVIGILAGLVLNTFRGIQARARDTERQTDVNAIATQLEVYHTDEGFYPALAEVNSTVLEGIDAEALLDPSGTSVVGTAEDGDNGYHYVTVPAACTTAAGDCESYTLSSTSEDDSSVVYEKLSLN